ADGVLALLTAPSQAQVGRVVCVAEGEAPMTAFVKTERGAAWVLLNLLNEQESREGRQCFGHGAAPSTRALKRSTVGTPQASPAHARRVLRGDREPANIRSPRVLAAAVPQESFEPASACRGARSATHQREPGGRREWDQKPTWFKAR